MLKKVVGKCKKFIKSIRGTKQPPHPHINRRTVSCVAMMCVSILFLSPLASTLGIFAATSVLKILGY